jgi:hypothetical protein
LATFDARYFEQVMLRAILTVSTQTGAFMKYAYIPALAACISLTGCGTLINSLTGGGGDDTVSARPITMPATTPDKKAELRDKLEYLSRVMTDSEVKCGDFLSQLVLGENTINTTGDVLGTVASALSTAFTPPGTKTAFSAAATIATGSKTAIDSDIYNKAAISDFATAIQKTYYTDAKNYTDALPKLTDTDSAPLILNNEIAKIQSIHAECALAPAESAIQAKLGTTTGQQTAPPPQPPVANQKNAGIKGAHGLVPVTSGQPLQPATTESAVPGTPW